MCVTFVSNRAYINRFFYTCSQVLSIGKYTGDICLVIGDDLDSTDIRSHPFITKNSIKVKYFPDILTDEGFLKQQATLKRPEHWCEKRFQFHKFYLFDTYFKQWDYIFYIDAGMCIYDDINPIIAFKKRDILLANRDGIDGETWDMDNNRIVNSLIGDGVGQAMTLSTQFVNYFQTTMMLYDTSIICDTTFSDIISLLLKYPISKTNDQGIVALYFTQIKPCWQQLPRKIGDIVTYDLVRCTTDKYIMVKYPNTTSEIGNGYFATYTGQCK
jgi:hypothetical protein